MNINKISQLFSYGVKDQKTAPAGPERPTASSNVNSEAVKVQEGFGFDSRAPERQAKVERLAREVANGTYKPDPIKVAESIARELFV